MFSPPYSYLTGIKKDLCTYPFVIHFSLVTWFFSMYGSTQTNNVLKILGTLTPPIAHPLSALPPLCHSQTQGSWRSCEITWLDQSRLKYRKDRLYLKINIVRLPPLILNLEMRSSNIFYFVRNVPTSLPYYLFVSSLVTREPHFFTCV